MFPNYNQPSISDSTTHQRPSEAHSQHGTSTDSVVKLETPVKWTNCLDFSFFDRLDIFKAFEPGLDTVHSSSEPATREFDDFLPSAQALHISRHEPDDCPLYLDSNIPDGNLHDAALSQPLINQPTVSEGTRHEEALVAFFTRGCDTVSDQPPWADLDTTLKRIKEDERVSLYECKSTFLTKPHLRMFFQCAFHESLAITERVSYTSLLVIQLADVLHTMIKKWQKDNDTLAWAKARQILLNLHGMNGREVQRMTNPRSYGLESVSFTQTDPHTSLSAGSTAGAVHRTRSGPNPLNASSDFAFHRRHQRRRRSTRTQSSYPAPVTAGHSANGTNMADGKPQLIIRLETHVDPMRPQNPYPVIRPAVVPQRSTTSKRKRVDDEDDNEALPTRIRGFLGC